MYTVDVWVRDHVKVEGSLMLLFTNGENPIPSIEVYKFPSQQLDLHLQSFHLQ